MWLECVLFGRSYFYVIKALYIECLQNAGCTLSVINTSQSNPVKTCHPHFTCENPETQKTVTCLRSHRQEVLEPETNQVHLISRSLFFGI